MPDTRSPEARVDGKIGRDPEVVFMRVEFREALGKRLAAEEPKSSVRTSEKSAIPTVYFWRRSRQGLLGGLLTLSTTTAPAFMTHFTL
jgi:hypothetical protein